MTTATESYWAETHTSHASKLVDRFGWQRVVDAAVRRVDGHGSAVLDALGVREETESRVEQRVVGIGGRRPRTVRGALAAMLVGVVVACAGATAAELYRAWSVVLPQDVALTMTDREPGRFPMTDAECLAVYGY